MKRWMKRLLALAAALVVQTELLPVTAQAAETPTSGEYGEYVWWHFDKHTGVLTIGGEGKMKDLNGADENAAPWFLSWHDDIKHVIIGEGVTSIGAYTFNDHCALIGVTLPQTLTHIGAAAFMDCAQLADIVIPDGVVDIGWSAFSGCVDLKRIKIPAGVTSIGDTAFFNCAGLEAVIFSDALTSIGMGAFAGCVDLTKLTIPMSVTIIGNRAFQNCSRLTEIAYQGTMAQWATMQIGEGAIDDDVIIHHRG